MRLMPNAPAALSLLVAATLLSACQTTATGRRQLILVSESDEAQLGLTAYEEVLKEVKLSTNAEQIAQVERVGKRIARAANRPDFKWEFKLIDDDKTVNAFCLPGGKIAVYSGLLAMAEGDAGLAAVIGHEVAHATLRHGGERMSQSQLVGLGEQAIILGMSKKDPAVVNAVRGAYGIGAKVGVLLPYSRTHETEADKMGLFLMARAGYHPREAVEFWKRMGAGAAGGIEFLSTHPLPATRVADLEKSLPLAMKEYRPQK